MADEIQRQVADEVEATEAIEEPWARMPHEPSNWYNRFFRFFLLAGTGRSIRKAYLLWLQEEKPEKYAAYQRGEVAYQSTPVTWRAIAEEWNWHERAAAYDAEKTREAERTVELARERLKVLALQAVDALEFNLLSEKYGVQAAKEILDRVGVSATQNVKVSGSLATVNAHITAEAADLTDEQLKERLRVLGQIALRLSGGE